MFLLSREIKLVRDRLRVLRLNASPGQVEVPMSDFAATVALIERMERELAIAHQRIDYLEADVSSLRDALEEVED